MMSNVVVSPLDVAQMIERVRENGEPVIRFVDIITADADADAYPTEKETYWGRRRRLESYWWSDACDYVFDNLITPIWKELHKRYWDAVIEERKNG